MRVLLAIAAFAFVSPAAAETVSLAPTAYDPEFMETLEDDLGVRETETLDEIVQTALRDALVRAGSTVEDGAAITIETTLVDARPNRPTFQQLSDRPGLDYTRSFGVGGAKIHGVVRGADGLVIREIDYRWYETDISWAAVASEWMDARRAIRRYADQVAEAVSAPRS